MANLVIISGPREGETMVLKPAGIVIGRSNVCDLQLPDDLAVSSNHVRIEQLGSDWILSDLESANGTSVNGLEVQTATLRDGDRIDVGETQFRFDAGGATAEEEGASPRTANIPVALAIEAPEPVPAPSPEPAPAAAPPPPPPAPKPAPAPAAFAATPSPGRVSFVAPPRPLPAGATADDVRLVEKMSEFTGAIRAEAAKVIVGQQEVLEQVLMCMVANGHALLIGMPGMAKTLMVKTIAQVLDLKFKRIQFTPDLMPTDITGTEVLETNRETMEKEFRFIQGPIFANILLADEINRTPPKTQAALLEAMQEKRVTVGNMTYPLEAPFFVLATQNPIEQEGTYPLPEAQMDRFMFNIWVDYPQEHEEEQIVSTTTVDTNVQPRKILGKEEILRLQEVTRRVPVSEHVIKYAIRLVRATRPSGDKAPEFIKHYVSVGAGPRAGQFLILAAKARAIIEGRIHVSCKDVKRAAIPVLRHRILTNFSADAEGMTTVKIIEKLLATTEEPSEKDYA